MTIRHHAEASPSTLRFHRRVLTPKFGLEVAEFQGMHFVTAAPGEDGSPACGLTFREHGVHLRLERLAWEHGRLKGELAVHSLAPDNATVGAAWSTTELTLADARSIRDQANFLAECRPELTRTAWSKMLNEISQHGLRTQRAGAEAIDLATHAPSLEETQSWDVDGFTLLRQHPVLLFGDGGCGKSYLALWIAGQLAQQGVPVGWFDWEMSADDHAARLALLFPDGKPSVQYVRCDQPLVGAVDQLRRVIETHQLQFVVFDSVAYASDGHTDSAEVAMAYFRSVRQLGPIGSLHIAHITKNGDKNKPIGSNFWHNSARGTWNVERKSNVVTVTPRKANLGPPADAFSYVQSFEGARTTFTRSNATPTKGGTNTTIDKVRAHLEANGPTTIADVAAATSIKVDTINKAVQRDNERTVARNEGRDGKPILSLIGQWGDPL